MPSSSVHRILGSGLLGGYTYTKKVLGTNPIAYWILGESAGATAIDQINSPAQDGTYTGVTLGQPGIGDGNTCPLFDGTNDYCDIDTAALVAAFDGEEGSLITWCRVSGVGAWTDGATRRTVMLIVSGSYYIFMSKSSGNNAVEWMYRANAINANRVKGGVSTTDFFCMGLTWSQSANQIIAYYNGVQEGATMAAPAAWVGAIGSAWIGSQDAVPNFAWDGYEAHVALYDTPLSSATMLRLATV